MFAMYAIHTMYPIKNALVFKSQLTNAIIPFLQDVISSDV